MDGVKVLTMVGNGSIRSTNQLNDAYTTDAVDRCDMFCNVQFSHHLRDLKITRKLVFLWKSQINYS